MTFGGLKQTSSGSACPICESENFGAADEVVDLDGLMRRWVDHGVVFDAETLKRYSSEAVGPIVLYRCESCQFGQYRPIVVGDSDFYSAIGRLEYYTKSKWEFNRSLEIIRSEGARSVIDVGCGSGLFLDHLRETLPSVQAVGVEINEAAATEARSRGHDVKVLDWNSTFSTDNLPKADLVVCHQVLEHVRDPVRFLEAIRAMLTDQGLAIISTPDSAGLVGTQTNSLTEKPPHHVTKWSEQTFKVALPRAGFQSVQAYYEPLPKILWEGYFPKIWEANAWPSHIGRVAAILGKFHGEGMNWVSDVLTEKGIPYVYGVGGHTILMTARPFALKEKESEKVVAKKDESRGQWSWLRGRRKKLITRKEAIEQATNDVVASAAKLVEDITKVSSLIADHDFDTSEYSEQPHLSAAVIIEVLAATVVALNQHYEIKAFLEESGYPCDTDAGV